MGTSTTTANNILKLIFNATAWANMADNAASSPLTNLYVAGHTADPGASGNQSTSELAYTSYARVAVARTTSGWTASSAASTSPVGAINFPTGTGGSGTMAYWSIGIAASSTTAILFSGTVTPNIVCGSGVTPSLTTGSTVTMS